MAVLVGSLPLYKTTTNNNRAVSVPHSLFLSSVPLNLLTSRCILRNPNVHSPLLRSRPSPCLAAKPGRPSPESDPNPEKPSRNGFVVSLSKFQDRVQIFFAVLFWMSLFFWSCVWDESNRPNKGSGFRR